MINMSDNNNAPMNKWVYYKNRKDSCIRYYMHRVQTVDAEMTIFIIHCEYGYGLPNCVRDEFVYATQDAAQKALNIMTNWEVREE